MEDVPPWGDARRRPGALRDPPTGPGRVHGRGGHALLHEDPEQGRARRARRRVLEPGVPPAKGELEEAHRRPGQRHVGVAMRPLADEAVARPAEPLHQARDRVGVAVRPAAHREDRALDRREVLAHGALLPEGVPPLVTEPRVDPEAAAAQALEPHRPPARADDCRVRGARVVGEHGRRPAQVVREQAPAHVVDVVRVAVVRRAGGDDRPERRGPAGGDLERVEPAPGVAHHAHPTGAPRLGGEPGDDLHRVVLLEREVLVGEDAVRVPAAAHVDPDAGVAVPGDVGMGQRVPLRGEVAPAVGEVLEDGGHGVGPGVRGEPHSRREPRPVLERDPDRVEPLDRPRERGHRGHGVGLYRLVGRGGERMVGPRTQTRPRR